MLPDYTSFYRQNERIAAELTRLFEEGVFGPLLDLLAESGERLDVNAWSPALGQEEYLGCFDPSKRPPWDPESYMAERTEQEIPVEEETLRIRLPDHVCPACGNDRNNYIKSAKRNCDGCGFVW